MLQAESCNFFVVCAEDVIALSCHPLMVSNGRDFATRFLRLFRRAKLLGNLLQERPKILEADRLSQMVVKSGLDAAPNIFLGSESQCGASHDQLPISRFNGFPDIAL